MRKRPYIRTGKGSSGFVLVMTLLAMAAIFAVIVAMLSLHLTESRSESVAKHLPVARNNAVLAFDEALANLQRMAGPDTRVTAPADAVAGATGGSRLVSGVWRSWEGLNHDTSGLPIAPDYGIKMADYDPANPTDGRFLGWLISSAEWKNPATTPPSVAAGNDTVPLLAEGTLGAGTSDEVHLVPNIIRDSDDTYDAGTYAWWVQGENTKARLRAQDTATTTLQAVDRVSVSPGPGISAFNVDNGDSLERVVNRPSLDFIASAGTKKPSEYFHDVSVISTGLLTNTANGGWRRDLSLFTEAFASLSNTFPSFSLDPENVKISTKSHVTGNVSQPPTIYPWVTWQSLPFQNSVSWQALADFSTQYKDLISSGDEVVEMMELANRDQTKWIDEVQRLPIIARVHYVLSLSAKPSGSDYQPCIVINPVVTMWNPYSVTLDASAFGDFTVELRQVSPFNFTFEAGSETVTTSVGNIVASVGTSSIRANIPGGAPAKWLPGEVRVFSAAGSTVVDKTRGRTAPTTFAAGYRPGSGLRYPIIGMSVQGGTTNLRVTDALVTDSFGGSSVSGRGLYFTVLRGGGGSNSTNNINCLLDTDAGVKSGMGEELTITASSVSLNSLSVTPSPFVSVVMGLRYGRDINASENNILVNGIHNMNPTVGYMSNGAGTLAEERMDFFPYDVNFFAVNGVADPGMPSGVTDELEGYLASGIGSGDGLSNLVLLEIPAQPLRSIGDLTHFNVNAPNARPPFTLNALGNSAASPVIASNQVLLPDVGGAVSDRSGVDHSYAINHALLDDWFVSSVAPDPDDWMATGGRSMQEVYEEHLSGDQVLPNTYYRPLEILGTAAAGAAASAFIGDTDAWQKVAADLYVEGMFNINSTSERAWAMLLKRNFAADGQGVLTLDSSIPGTTATASLQQNPDPLTPSTVFPRTKLTSDSTAGGLGGGELLSQPHRFTDDQINALAREIVAEIKKRGPFLSLSEFFNRQLSTDVDLAKAGAVESALLTLSRTSGSENPYTDLQTEFSDVASADDMLGNMLTYPFPEAAAGNLAYGFPGWVRQADVLRSISGVLSARDDTFTIRAYGDSKNQMGKTVARVWCEAVVRRQAEYVNNSSLSGDDKYHLPDGSGNIDFQSDVNQRFGRKFEVVEFRWLNPDEV